jgi:CubicO group peptidase (beta-lactamase class C family)
MRPVSLAWRFLSVLLLHGLSPGALRSAEPRVVDSLRPFVDRGTLAGAVVLVVDPEKVLCLEAFGYSDVAAKRPMQTDDLFWVASMAKPMTATALMMLVDEGKVRLDDPVEKYLPEFRNQMVAVEKDKDHALLKKPGHPITVREILSHTSGLVDRSPLETRLDTLSLHDGVVTYALSPLKFEPGTKYEYCNPGINTAGRIIEVVSGTPYEDFMQKRLFDPLGMRDTTFWPTEEQLKRLAKSYKPGPDKKSLEETTITQLTYPLTDRKRHPYPAGGLFSTATDVAAFGRMILNGGVHEGKRLVSEAAVREMTSTQTGDLNNKGKGEAGYGLGFTTSRKSRGGSGRVIPGPCGHGGAYATNLGIDPDHQLVTVYMVQHAGYPGRDGEKIHPAFVKAAVAEFGGK